MEDNAQNIQPQDIQQPVRPIENPVREFIQVDTSTNAFMGKKIPVQKQGMAEK